MGATSVMASIIYAAVYGAWLMLLASYLWARWVGLLGNQIALHRYFAHRSFKTTPIKHHILLWFSILGGEGLHNNHHHDTSQYNQAFNPGKFDFGGWLVKKFLALPNKSLTTPLASSKIQHV